MSEMRAILEERKQAKKKVDDEWRYYLRYLRDWFIRRRDEDWDDVNLPAFDFRSYE